MPKSLVIAWKCLALVGLNKALCYDWAPCCRSSVWVCSFRMLGVWSLDGDDDDDCKYFAMNTVTTKNITPMIVILIIIAIAQGRSRCAACTPGLQLIAA